MVDVIINDVPPSFNEIARSVHWSKYSRLKKKWTKKVQNACPLIPCMFENPVVITVTYTFGTKRKRDFDNFAASYKLLGDGLIGRVIKDDNSDYVKELRIRFAYEKGVKKTTISVEEIK